MDNIIEALQQNEKPLGLMSEAMQAKAKEMSLGGDLQQFTCNGRWENHLKGHVLRESTTYCLREDYTEPEVEIMKQKWEDPERAPNAAIIQLQGACKNLIDSVNTLNELCRKQ